MKHKRDISLGRASRLPKLTMVRLIGLISIIGIAYISGTRLSGLHILDWDWRRALFGILSLIAWISFLFSLLRLAACIAPKPSKFQPKNISHELPQYTVLVPLYKEANMVRGLMHSLEGIRYPHGKLQILLICEAVDPKTIASVNFHMRAPFELIIVPKGSPQTKPRALNYAMQYARGEFITIYDASVPPIWTT